MRRSEQQRQKAVRRSHTRGLVQVLRGSAGDEPHPRDVSAALILAEILRDAQEHPDPDTRNGARKLWLKASVLSS